MADKRAILPLARHVEWKGIGILALVVETFARTGSKTATCAELRFAPRSNAVDGFLFGVLALPRGEHGGNRRGRHPAADIALRHWKRRRREIEALYAPRRVGVGCVKYSDDAIRKAFAKAGTVMGAARLLGSAPMPVSRRLDVLGIARPGKAEGSRIGQAAKRAQAVTE